MAALRRARPQAAPVDDRRLPLDRRAASAARVRRACARVDHDAADRRLAGRAGRGGRDANGEGLSARTINKYLGVMHSILKRAQRTYGLAANAAAGAERQPVTPLRRLRRALGGGGRGPGARRPRGAPPQAAQAPDRPGVAGEAAPAGPAGRRDLPHRRLRRPAPRRAAQPALARPRLRQAADPRPPLLRAAKRGRAEVRPRPQRADDRPGGARRSISSAAATAGPGRRTSSSSTRPASTSRTRRFGAASTRP